MITETDPGVDFVWDYWPFMEDLRDMVGGVGALILIALVGVTFVMGLVWAASRMVGASRMQSFTGGAFLVLLAATLIVGGASALINWVAGKGDGLFAAGDPSVVTSVVDAAGLLVGLV